MVEGSSEIKTPNFKAPSFTCPFCHVVSAQYWRMSDVFNCKDNNKAYFHKLWFSECHHCNKNAAWFEEKLIYPKSITVTSPNPDMEQDIQNLYNEAAFILNDSPRAAAALLRLAVNKLCMQLGEKGRDLNTDIKKPCSKRFRCFLATKFRLFTNCWK